MYRWRSKARPDNCQCGPFVAWSMAKFHLIVGASLTCRTGASGRVSALRSNMERLGDVMRVRIAALSAVGTVGILALVVATPARAETSILARAGSWEAFSGTTT